MDKDIRQYLHYYLGKARVRHRYVDYEQGVWTVWEKLTIDHYDRLLNDLSIDGIQLELRKLESMTDEEADDSGIASDGGEYIYGCLEPDAVYGSWGATIGAEAAAARLHAMMKAGFWVFGNDWFDEGIIIDKSTIK